MSYAVYLLIEENTDHNGTPDGITNVIRARHKANLAERHRTHKQADLLPDIVSSKGAPLAT